MATMNVEVGGKLVPIEYQVGPAPHQAGGIPDDVTASFERAQEMMVGLAKGFHESLTKLAESMRPDEVELTFGLKLTAESGWLVAKAGGEANFEVTLKWGASKSG
jgi:hypothetical protein